jgi:RNA polymerase sigma factor (sigma-70 family)
MINKQNTTDSHLASLVKESADTDALSTLIDRHSGICYKIYNKYFYNNKSSFAKDVEEQKDLLIYQAAKTFNPDFGTKFSTWLGNVITYACLNACNEQKKELSLDDDILKYLTDSYSNHESSFYIKEAEILNHIKDIIDMSSDETSKEVIKMRYFTDDKKVKTFKEIADHFGVSTQTVVNWHDKFISFLKNKLKSNTTLDIL